MKRIIYMSLILAALLSSAGCEDYLGIKPRGYDVACRIEHYEGLIYGTETAMLDEVFPFMCFEWTTDEEAYPNIYSLIGSDATNAYKWQADIFRPDENCGEWNHPSNLLYPLNIIVNEVMTAENGTDEQKMEILSEARVLRAYMTFLMAQFFGKPYDESIAASELCVPIITEASTTGNDFSRRTVKEVYDFVLTEMNEAVKYLPSRKEHFSRAFKVTGNAMLGKVYWMMGDYESAAGPLTEAMSGLAAAGCGFLDYNEMVNESGEITYPVDDLLNPELIYNIELLTNIWSSMYPSYYGSALFTLKTDVLKKYYSQGDLRLCFISGMKSLTTAYNKFGANDVYYMNLSNFVSNIGITVPDLYLMYAETMARTGNEGEAVRALNEMRNNRMDPARAEVVASGDDLIRFAVAERMRENIGRAMTWFDTRRLWDDPLFQDLKEMYVHTVGAEEYVLTEDRLVMRIPPSVMQWHPEYIDNK